MACIYKITNNVNEKFYIGKTKRSNLSRRWKEHQWKALDENCRHPLYDGIRHHGLENFSIEVLEECQLAVLDIREKFWITKLRPVYNLTFGGEGGDTFTHKPEHMKEETRKKLSLAAKKNAQNPEYLKKVSDGVKRAIETKKDIWSECKKGSKNGRWLGKIEMYDSQGNLFKTYETAVECRKDTGMVAHNIRSKARTGAVILRGKFKGYTFKIVL